jgi:transposase
MRSTDESRVEVGLRLTYGYSARSERCYDSAPFRSGVVRSLVGWLGLDGSGVVATHEGTVRGWTFRGFVRCHLVPHLRPGDVVIWDNARIHRVEQVREMIEACGAEVLPLPRYKPGPEPADLIRSAIEMAWSKIKQVVKRLRAENAEALEAAVASGVEAVRATDAEGWFRHCSYLHQHN